jgi:DNA primase
MELVIQGKLIDADIKDILETLRRETGYKYFKLIKEINGGDKLMVTCPWHKDGQENHPSCCVSNNDKDEKYEKGFFHCFTCGKHYSLPNVVAHCLGEDDVKTGEDWLVERFGNVFVKKSFDLTDIELPTSHITNNRQGYLDESILNNYNYYNDYMWERKLTKDVVDRFDVGYNPLNRTLTFPVRDERGGLVFITERSIDNKFFIIPEDVDKPVYLLYEVLKQDYPFVVVCEGQIDALTCWSYGVPAVALFGVGSSKQYDLLNKTGIRNWVTFFDNDFAGKKATNRFNKMIRKDVFVTNLSCSAVNKKDVNDLTIQEFDKILDDNGIYYRIDR